MATELSFILKDQGGKSNLTEIRNAGNVPAVIYGKGQDNVFIVINEKEFNNLIKQHLCANIIVTLKGEGKEIKVFIQDLQVHPITKAILHVDFLAINDKQIIKTKVPVVFTGEAVGVKAGGLLQRLVYKLPITCLPKDLPTKIEIDVTDLNVGDVRKVRQITLPEGIKTRFNDDVVLALVAKTRAATSAAATSGEGEAAAEGEG